jgi:hypothetical protein
MQASIVIVVIAGLLALGVTAADVKKAEEERDTFQLLQLKLFSEISTFADTWAADTPKCQFLAHFTRHSMDRFFDQNDHPERYAELDKANQQKAEELSKELGCEKDNANMWKRYFSLHQVFNLNSAQLNKVIQRLQEAEKQLQQENAKTKAKSEPDRH